MEMEAWTCIPAIVTGVAGLIAIILGPIAATDILRKFHWYYFLPGIALWTISGSFLWYDQNWLEISLKDYQALEEARADFGMEIFDAMVDGMVSKWEYRTIVGRAEKLSEAAEIKRIKNSMLAAEMERFRSMGIDVSQQDKKRLVPIPHNNVPIRDLAQEGVQ